MAESPADEYTVTRERKRERSFTAPVGIEGRFCLAYIMRKSRPPVSTATRLPPVNLDVSTAEGLAKAYAIGAGEILADARALNENLFSDRTGHFVITMHTLELGLKAFLIAKGYTEEKLRRSPYGHNLVELLKAAKAEGLVLTTAYADELIEWINEWHYDDVKIRYEFTEERSLPMCGVLFPLASEIIQKTAIPPKSVIDRVSPINPDGSVSEVHSVGLNTHPHIYARWLLELDRKRSKPNNRYLIDLKDGKSITISGDEVIARAVATGLPAL